MTQRLVVCFRAPERFSEPAEYLAMVRALLERATTHGGRLAAWGATVTAFDFDSDAIDDVIELSLTVVKEAASGLEHAVGVSEGVLVRLADEGPLEAVAWGEPLVRATVLARAAHPGEILIDPLVSAAKRGDLQTHGSRVGVHGKDRLRGLVLDPKHPYRTRLGTSAKTLGRPELVGGLDLSPLDVRGGMLGIVRAPRGHGGTRVLEELEQRLEPARVLSLSPHPFGEPLGALRRALLRGVTLGHAPQHLGGQAGEGLDALLAGEGLDPDSSAELLATWLTPDSVSDPRGVALLDDASEIDADTLEVIARAAASAGEPFRVIARLGASEPIPKALAALPVGGEVNVAALSADDAAALARACTHGDLDAENAARWALRGGRLPLGIVETIRESIDAGEIAWEDGHVVVRPRASFGEAAGTPKHWVKRRLAQQEGDERLVLEAVAILGGHVESAELTGVLRGKHGASFDSGAVLAVLEAAGWLSRRKPDVFALPTATHRDAVLSTLSDSEFQSWHRAVSEWFSSRDRPLSAAAATVHAILSGDSERALELSRRAAAATRAMGLETTADAFERFGAEGDVAALAGRYLFTSQLEMARAVPSVWPDARSSFPPASSAVRESPTPSRRPVPPPKPAWSKRPPAGGSIAPTSKAAPPGASEPPSAAVEALRKGDLEAVERMAAQMRVGEAKTGLAERLQAMAKLARGETGDAIRRLREAADESRRTGSRDRCRAALALAVALGAAGRSEEALLEVLDGLARARELKDPRGEQACLKFLSRLAATAGHHDVAEAWAAVAET